VRSKVAALVLTVFLGACDNPDTGHVHDSVPPRLDLTRTHVLYLHDHPRDGGRSERITAALAGRGFEVIAEVRAADVAPDISASRVRDHIRGLLARGVPLEKLAVMGPGAGGRMAMAVAYLVRTPGIRYVALAACPREGRPGACMHHDRRDRPPKCTAIGLNRSSRR